MVNLNRRRVVSLTEYYSLSDAQREKLIGDHNLLGELAFVNKPNYDPDADLYCTIRLNNAGFWVDKGETEPWKKPVLQSDGTTKLEDSEREVLTRKFDDTVDFMVNYTAPEGVKIDSTGLEVVVVSPYPFLSKLVELLLRDNKMFVRNSFIHTDETLKTLCLYNNVSICKAVNVPTPTEVLTFTLNPYHADYIGSQEGTDTITIELIELQTWQTNTMELKKLLPKLGLNELLLSVQNLTNTFFHFSGINDVDNIDRESLFDMEPFDLSKYRVSRWLPDTRQNLCLKFKFDHDADDQEFNENFTDISSREDDKKEAVQTYPDLLAIEEKAIGNIRLVIVEKMYYEYRQETIDDGDVLMWAPLTIDLQDYKYNSTGDNSEDIQTKFSTLRTHKNGYPIAYQRGNNSQFSQYSENFTPRLMFYNGNNTGGATATSGLAIDWKSLVANRYRRTAPFYANALPVIADFRFPGNIFYKVLNEIYIPFLDRDGSFFIKEMEVRANNSDFVDVTITAFKNEDNVFDPSTGTVDGGGEHVGSVFVPKFIGVTESGWPMLVNAQGLQRPMPVFGDISGAAFSANTCIAYDATDKLLFVGGNNGQLHVCDLSDMDNIRYKTIQIFAGADDVSCVSLTTFSNGTGKALFVGRANGCAAWLQPYHALFADYVSNQAVQIGSFDHGTGWIRGVIVSNGYYYACSKDGEVHRASGWEDVWQQCADIDGTGGHGAEFISIAQTQNHIWAAEVNDDSLYSAKSNPAQFSRFNGLSGIKRQKPRDLQALLGGKILWMCADANECIWLIDQGAYNGNITPDGVLSAGGACFDGVKFAHISVKVGDNEATAYTKIATYNADLHIPEAPWSYLNVSSFFTKLFLY